MDISYLHPQFILNEKGDKTAVIISLDKYNKLVEDLMDLAKMAEKRDEPSISHDKVLEELKNEGLL
ncbi:MAG: hypothetical protein JW969_12500 [Spirochaetales bacterium]|nr:hypothetical protein [Spirochaetales bacterium]